MRIVSDLGRKQELCRIVVLYSLSRKSVTVDPVVGPVHREAESSIIFRYKNLGSMP